MQFRGAAIPIMVSWVAVAAIGCARPQDLPVVVAPESGTNRLQWRDAHGPLRGEVPWVLRTDVLGADTFLVVETDDGDHCAKEVSFRVLAGGATEYTVHLSSDLDGKVSWRVTYGSNKKLKLFTCSPRPADDRRRACIHGGIPKPLFGELVGGMTAELVDDGVETTAHALRFVRSYQCGPELEKPPDQVPTSASPDAGPES
jgi:hypothetical protein